VPWTAQTLTPCSSNSHVGAAITRHEHLFCEAFDEYDPAREHEFRSRRIQVPRQVLPRLVTELRLTGAEGRGLAINVAQDYELARRRDRHDVRAVRRHERAALVVVLGEEA
jgi:hypothetical protein